MAEWQTHVTEDALAIRSLANLTLPKISNKLDLDWSAAVERLAVNSIKNFDPRRHRLVGWNRNAYDRTGFTDYEVHVVYEDCDMVA